MADGTTDNADILSQAATATQGMVPGVGDTVKGGGMTSFSPQVVPPPPIPQYKAPDIQFGKAGNEFQTASGRKRADRQALISNTINLFKSVTDFQQAKKMRSLQMDIGKILELSQGITEAKNILQDPNATPEQKQQAQQALQQNAQNLNSIASDPKRAKQILKAFNIDLMGGGKNQKENQAFINAFKEFQQKQAAGDKTALNPMAQAIMGSMPVRQGLSPEAMAQAQAVKAGLIPTANALIKAYADNYRTLQTAKSSEARTAAMLDHDKILEANAKLLASAKDKQTQAYLERTITMRMNAQDRDKVMLRVQQMKSADNDKRIAALTTIAADKSINEKDRTLLGSLNKEAQTYHNQIKSLMEENTKYEADLAKTTKGIFGLPTPALSKADAQSLRIKIGMNNAAIKAYQNSFDDVQGKIDVLHKMGIVTLMPQDDTSGTGEGTQDEPLPPPDDND